MRENITILGGKQMNYRKKTKRILSILMVLTVLFTTTLPVFAADNTATSLAMTRAVPNFIEQRPVVIADSSPGIQFTGNWVSFSVRIVNPADITNITTRPVVNLRRSDNSALMAKVEVPLDGSSKSGNAYIQPGTSYYFEYSTGYANIIWFAIGAASTTI